MSTDWNVHCADCDDTHTFDDANHRDDVMGALCKHAVAIAGLADLEKETGGWNVRLETPWGGVDPEWFRAHLGHKLVPINEYGQILGKCTGWAEGCRPCGLEPGHVGEHAPRMRSR